MAQPSCIRKFTSGSRSVRSDTQQGRSVFHPNMRRKEEATRGDSDVMHGPPRSSRWGLHRNSGARLSHIKRLYIRWSKELRSRHHPSSAGPILLVCRSSTWVWLRATTPAVLLAVAALEKVMWARRRVEAVAAMVRQSQPGRGDRPRLHHWLGSPGFRVPDGWRVSTGWTHLRAFTRSSSRSCTYMPDPRS